jgi:hypothetical protein
VDFNGSQRKAEILKNSANFWLLADWKAGEAGSGISFLLSDSIRELHANIIKISNRTEEFQP